MLKISKIKFLSLGVFALVTVVSCQSAEEAAQCEELAKKPETAFRSVNVRKVHATDPHVFLPSEYKENLINSKPIDYTPNDTLRLKEINRETVEFEILADSSVEFEDIDIEAAGKADYDYRGGKPWITKNRESYSFQPGKALFIFFPFVYGSIDGNGIVRVRVDFSKNGCSAFKVFHLQLLSGDEYAAFIRNKLPESKRKLRDELLKKYETLFSKYTVNEWSGTKKRGSYSLVTNLEKFERQHGIIFKRSKFTNQYEVVDKGFRVIVTVGNKQRVEVEPVN